VGGYCVGELPAAALRPDAKLDPTKAKGCLGHPRSMLTACVSSIPGTWVPSVHTVCMHNEYAALVKRTLGPTPSPGEEGCGSMRAAFLRLKSVASRYRGPRWDYLETAQSYSGALRRRYLEAERLLREDGPVCSSDTFLQAFLKAEKRKPWDVAKPRMIFPRSPRYNLHLASWLKPFEHWLWGNLKSRALSGVGNSRVVAKGLNQVQRANLIVSKMSKLADCVVFEVDGKAFEAHISVDQLVMEHSVYLTAYGGDPDLQRALSHQLRNKGRTMYGTKFSRLGGRASGDYNTGMGNSLIMLAIVKASMDHIGHREWDTLVDGDNALIFLPGDTAERVRAAFPAAASFVAGHTMTLEQSVTKVESITFGQSRPLKIKGGWKMVRDYRKVVSHGTSSHANLGEPRYALEYLRGVACCEASLADEVPILWRWSNHLLAQTESVRRVRQRGLADYQVMGVDLDKVLSEPGLAKPPDDETRASFAAAFGIGPDEQLRLESLLLRDRVIVTPVKEWDREFQLAWSIEEK